MKLSIGIVGLPNVGKSTLFRLLTKQQVVVANYPFATIDPNIGIVPVPDKRLSTLTALSKSKKTLPAVIEFYDIAGLVRGASTGEGLGNQFLSHIREVNAVLHVIRCFGGDEIIHIDGSVNGLRDLETIQMELVFKDLDTVERRLVKAEADSRSGKKESIAIRDALLEMKEILSRGECIRGKRTAGLYASDVVCKEMNLLTDKPPLFFINGDDADVPESLKEQIRAMGGRYIAANLAYAESVPDLIVAAYETLALMSFFTTGEDETRAWTIESGMKAPQAAGAIHSDFEAKFIRAEVVAYSDFISAGGWNQAKQRGFLRVEGKEYIVKDGDILIIRHG